VESACCRDGDVQTLQKELEVSGGAGRKQVRKQKKEQRTSYGDMYNCLAN